MKGFNNQSLNRDDDGENPMPYHEGPSVDNPGRGQGAFNKRLFPAEPTPSLPSG